MTQSAVDWYRSMPAPSVLEKFWAGSEAVLRRYDDTSANLCQPSLSENIIAIHLRGPKRVWRRRDVHTQIWDVSKNSLTFMPACQANEWVTEGPISFVHLAVSSGLLHRLADEEFRRDARDLAFLDRVGVTDDLLSQLMLALLDECSSHDAHQLYRDSLLSSLVIASLKRHSTQSRAEPRRVSCGGLASWQLKRVMDYMMDHLASDIGLSELIDLTGLSRSQFFRAFRQSTGETPNRILTNKRMELARKLLLNPDTNVKAVARAVGYTRDGHFAAAFARVNGVTPRAWQRFESTRPVRRCVAETLSAPR